MIATLSGHINTRRSVIFSSNQPVTPSGLMSMSVWVAILVCSAVCTALPLNNSLTVEDDPTLYSKMEYFQGCFDAGPSYFQLVINSRKNTNSQCASFCRDAGYIVSVTRGETCGCTDTLPLPQNARPEDSTSAGPKSKCNKVCPGAYNQGQCYDDECCGGGDAYSAYAIGSVDVLLLTTRRIKANMEKDQRWFYTRFFRFVQKNGVTMDISKSQVVSVTKFVNYVEECEDKCHDRWDCDGYSWSASTKECLLWTNAVFGPTDTRYVSATLFYGFKRRRGYGVNSSKRIKSIKFDWFYTECEEQCLAIDDCTGYTWNDYTLECNMYRGVSDFGSAGDSRWNAAVITVGQADNAWIISRGNSIDQDGKSTYKECKVSIFGNAEECKNLASYPTDSLYLEVQLVETLIEHDLGGSLEPYGERDMEIDNLYGSTTVTASDTYTISQSVSDGYSTEAGTEISTTFGTSLTMGFEAFGFKSEMEMRTEMTNTAFFKAGYQKSFTEQYSESKSFTLPVPPYHKGYLNVFKQSYRLQTKWRTTMFAQGFVTLQLEDTIRQTNVVEVLDTVDRTLFAFGTVDFGDREKLIAVIKIVDRNGNVVTETDSE